MSEPSQSEKEAKARRAREVIGFYSRLAQIEIDECRKAGLRVEVAYPNGATAEIQFVPPIVVK